MTDLLTRLAAAPEGTRALSDEYLLARGWKPQCDGTIWRSLIGKLFARSSRPHVTGSLDDAVEWMVPEGAEYEFTNLYGVALAGVGLNFENGPSYGDHRGGDVCIAFCIASLRAHEAGWDE